MQRLLYILLLWLFVSCTKDNDSEKNQSVSILGKWKVLSSTIYEITPTSITQFRRLDHPLMADSVFFYANGILKSYALTYNFGTGDFTYSFDVSQNHIQTNMHSSYPLWPQYLSFHVQLLSPGQLILHREYLDTTSLYPLIVKQRNAIDSLYR